jgi:hypothetical protein
VNPELERPSKYHAFLLWVLLAFIMVKDGAEVLHFLVATYVVPTAQLLIQTWRLLQSLWK